MAKAKMEIDTINFVDAGRGDETRTANIVWRIATAGGVTFTVPISFDLDPGKEHLLIPYARAAIHHLLRHLVEQTVEWAEP